MFALVYWGAWGRASSKHRINITKVRSDSYAISNDRFTPKIYWRIDAGFSPLGGGYSQGWQFPELSGSQGG
jgi:hypothetical protein